MLRFTGKTGRILTALLLIFTLSASQAMTVLAAETESSAEETSAETAAEDPADEQTVIEINTRSDIRKLAKDPELSDWNRLLLKTVAKVPLGGGYNTANGITTERAMANAVKMKNGKLSVSMKKARPSYCSSACYMVLLQTLAKWDTEGKISKKAWKYLRPYSVSGMEWPWQGDGVGCWGMANANGPGMAVLIKKLKAGNSFLINQKSAYKKEQNYWKAWSKAKPGDFMKIFRDEAIGANERGHMVVYLGSSYAETDGERDDIVYYWSSQSTTNGYGIKSCRASEICRAVITQITKPAKFKRAKYIKPTKKNAYLASMLVVRNASVKKMKKQIK